MSDPRPPAPLPRPFLPLLLLPLLLLPLLLALFPAPTKAQRPPAPAADAPLPIQDNSFLVEEAYNQGRGIVQHVSTFERVRGGGGGTEWRYTFTQEWPVAGQRHQLSYMVPLARVDAQGAPGVGDLNVNYRYQAGRMEGARAAFAPRLTLLLPTGASGRSLGAGGTGVQVNLPLSVELPAQLVVHSNVGGTHTPRARNTDGARAAATAVTLGQSVVWLAHPRFNLMLEGVWSRAQEVTGPGTTEWGTETIIAPGVRGAIDFPSGLQVVPGLAFPIGVGPSRGERGVYLYLSLEHSFTGHAP